MTACLIFKQCSDGVDSCDQSFLSKIKYSFSASSEVVFFFDVGNGPVEVRVKTSLRLNDDRWHTVRAERNVKEASLRVDNFPAETQDAPADGLIHLQLNSPLFVGERKI